MKILIALILLGLTVSLSTRVLADEHSKLRVVVVETDDAPAYITQLNKGSNANKKAITPKNDNPRLASHFRWRCDRRDDSWPRISGIPCRLCERMGKSAS